MTVRDLTPEELQRMDTDGFVVLPEVFAAQQLRPLEAACERLEVMAEELHANGARGATMHRGSQFVLGGVESGLRAGQVRIDRVVWAGAAVPELLDFGADPQLTHWAAQILASRQLQQIINQVHFKLPGDGVAFGWHQDSVHRRFGTDLWTDVNGRGSFVEIATFLDDNTPENGPLQFVRGSQVHGHLGIDAQGQVPGQYLDADQMVPALGQAGSVVLFGPFVIHGSAPNRSTRKRRMLLNGFAVPGANRRVYPGEGAGRIVQAA